MCVCVCVCVWRENKIHRSVTKFKHGIRIWTLGLRSVGCIGAGSYCSTWRQGWGEQVCCVCVCVCVCVRACVCVCVRLCVDTNCLNWEWAIHSSIIRKIIFIHLSLGSFLRLLQRQSVPTSWLSCSSICRMAAMFPHLCVCAGWLLP